MKLEDMTMSDAMPPYPRKPVPRHIAIFGAAGRMGGAVAGYLAYASPETTLRLLSSSPAGVAQLAVHPAAKHAAADYLDPPSLAAALDGVDGVFVVTPSGLDEHAAMTNLVNAVRSVGTVRHIVRVVGYEPEATLARVPPHLASRRGDGTQHFVAKALLDDSGLPVTFLNCGATLMDNFRWFRQPIAERDVFVYPPRLVPFVDVRDLGEIAARLLLSDDARHISQFHTVNNGNDLLTTPEVTAMLSDVLRRPIRLDASREGFLREYGPAMDADQPGEAEYRWDFMAFELRNAVVWALNDFAERTLGRRPTTLRAWLMEHRSLFARPGA